MQDWQNNPNKQKICINYGWSRGLADKIDKKKPVLLLFLSNFAYKVVR